MLEVEVIQENLSLFYETINEYISEPRRSKLLKFYKSREELLALAPASSKKQYHGAYPGG